MNLSSFWFPLAAAVAALFVVALVVAIVSLARSRVRPSSPEEREDLAHLPLTPFQKRAWWSLAITVAMVTGCVVVIARHGPVAYFDDAGGRTLVIVFVMVAMISHLVVVVPAGLRARSGRGSDERDRSVLASAPMLQAAACLVTTAAWAIALTEGYRGAGIPTGFMALVFWSVFLAQILAHSGGILLGYHLERNHAQG